MATFVVGDIHGKYTQLRELLELIQFDEQEDILWCTGDLINRGKKSLEVLQFCQDLGNRFITVLGNHDLFLLALYYGYQSEKKIPKCLDRILQSAQADQLLKWLSNQPFIHYDKKLQTILVHAGLPPLSDLSELLEANQKLQELFQSDEKRAELKDFLCSHMMGNEPRHTNDIQHLHDYYRYFINCYTRMRYCNPKGAPRYGYKGKPSKAPINRIPWFELENHKITSSKSPQYRVLFGHWATLSKQPILSERVFHLDDGCAWRGHLTALCLEGCQQRRYQANQRFSICCG